MDHPPIPTDELNTLIELAQDAYLSNEAPWQIDEDDRHSDEFDVVGADTTIIAERLTETDAAYMVCFQPETMFRVLKRLEALEAEVHTCPKCGVNCKECKCVYEKLAAFDHLATAVEPFVKWIHAWSNSSGQPAVDEVPSPDDFRALLEAYGNIQE